ncbi:MAG: flagellar export protein FliJ [Pseudomonadales bacterium]
MRTTQRIKALQVAQQLAAADKDQAASHLQAQQRRAQAAEQQLLQLRSFHADYAVAASKLGDARQLQQYYAFLTRLNRSIGQQQAALITSQQAVEDSRDRWARLYQRSAALGKALDKAQRQYARDLDKRSDLL